MRASALCIIRKQEELIMKIGVSSYSFHQTVSAGRMSTYDIVDAAAKMGFEEIDFAVLLGDDPLEEMCKKLGKQAKDAGIGVSNYAVAADFLNKNLDEEVERVKGELRNAVLLGAHTLRHDAAWKLPRTAPSAPSVRRCPASRRAVAASPNTPKPSASAP